MNQAARKKANHQIKGVDNTSLILNLISKNQHQKSGEFLSLTLEAKTHIVILMTIPPTTLGLQIFIKVSLKKIMIYSIFNNVLSFSSSGTSKDQKR